MIRSRSSAAGAARGLCLLLVTLASLVIRTPAAGAVDPYEINVILPLTGNIAFVGASQLVALKSLETYVNRTGGINGRPLAFVVSDDQADPKNALLLAQGMIAKNVPIIMGSSSPQACAAIAPLITQTGPLLYCLANAGHPTPGGYEFLTLFPYEPQFAVTFRYFRERGLKKLAYIVSIDAGGQDAERAILATAALPENKDVQIVAHEHFSAGDISTVAQMSRIKAAKPDALLAWATGGPTGTIFRSARDTGLDLPTVTSTGNLNAAFFKQYGPVLPTDLYFAGVSYYAGAALEPPATRAAIATLTSELALTGAKPDMIEISAWDPAMILIDALRKLGTDASAPKLRAYLANLRGWTGVNGPYDFRANPQRGIGENNIVMVRWDAQHGAAMPVSTFGGSPLPSK